jgi:hypothetical protein
LLSELGTDNEKKIEPEPTPNPTTRNQQQSLTATPDKLQTALNNHATPDNEQQKTPTRIQPTINTNAQKVTPNNRLGMNKHTKIKQTRLETTLLLDPHPTTLLQTEVVEILIPRLSVEGDNDNVILFSTLSVTNLSSTT